MEKNFQNPLESLRRTLSPMKALILAELFLAMALVLWINNGAGHRSNSFFLLNLVITLLQPKTQFGLVWSWQDKMKELGGAASEAMRQGIEDLEKLRKEGVDQTRVYLMVSPVLLLLELGVSEQITLAPGIVFGAVSCLIFEVWQRRYRRDLGALSREAWAV